MDEKKAKNKKYAGSMIEEQKSAENSSYIQNSGTEEKSPIRKRY
jgi:hypothetical protein